MKATTEKIGARLRAVPPATTCAFLTCAAYGLVAALESAQRDAALALWGFGLAMAICLWFKPQGGAVRVPPPFSARVSGCALLGLSLMFGYLRMRAISYLLCGLGAVVFFGGWSPFLIAAGAFSVWFAMVPRTELLHHLVSYPMRLIVAHVSAAVLALFGWNVVADATSVLIDGRVIAVTAACSGIEQLEALLLYAFAVACLLHRGWGARWLHFLLILPLILAFNVARLCVTLVGNECVGPVFLGDTAHEILGWGTVLLICLSFYWAGGLFHTAPAKKAQGPA